MTDIKNTEYITINANGIFVGGKPATTYRGKKIAWIAYVRKYFADIQKLNPNVVELHVLSSETRGEYAVVGNPSGKHGPNVWCRVKFNDGRIGAWVFGDTSSSAANCAGYCAAGCAANVRASASFRSAVFGAVMDKNNAQVRGGMDPVATPVTAVAQKISEGTKVYEMGDYRITVIVERIKQNTK